MKLLTIAVPCYNSAAYMENCIDSLLNGGEDVEILIVDDGSADGTASIADRYEAQYPGIVKAIHKENGGHGSAVNTGLAHASGIYFKVVDSDDYLRKPALLETLQKLKELTPYYDPEAEEVPSVEEDEALDLLICNFVYNKECENRKKVMQYRKPLPEGRIFTWKEIGHFGPGHYILMHSVIYRTELLRKCGLILPEHCFYVDNIYVWQPLPYVKNIYYLDVNLYFYYIGRTDQSVNETVMIRRLDQQIRVNRLMFDHFCDPSTAEALEKIDPAGRKKLKAYMFNYLKIITMVSSVLPAVSGAPEDLEKRKEMWAYMKEKDHKLWRALRFDPTGIASNLGGKAGRAAVRECYRIAKHFYNFN